MTMVCFKNLNSIKEYCKSEKMLIACLVRGVKYGIPEMWVHAFCRIPDARGSYRLQKFEKYFEK